MKESYRFFLLNYVIKEGKHFFLEAFATQLQREAFETHFKDIDVLINTCTYFLYREEAKVDIVAAKHVLV